MPPIPPPRGKPPAAGAGHERRKQARPGELLDAALDLFVEKGFAATRVEEVAARAGVSKATLFLYFPSKQALFKAVVRQTIAGRLLKWSSWFEGFQGSTHDMLRDCLHAWWEHVGTAKTSGLTKLMVSEAGNFPEIAALYQQEIVQPGHALIRRILQRGIDRGEFRRMDLDYAVYSVAAPMCFLLLSRHSLGVCIPSQLAVDPEKYIASQLSIILYGMSAPPGDAAPDGRQA